MSNKIGAGDRRIIRTIDADMRHLNGRAVTIVRVIDEPDEAHDPEVLPMFVDQDGHEWWADELHPSEGAI